MGGAARYVAAHLVRRHWRATLVLGVGLGLVAAVPVTAWGVARRTDRAFPAFRESSLRGVAGVRVAIFCPGETFEGCQGYNPVAEQRIVSQWPEVRATLRDSSAIASVSTAVQPGPTRIIVEAQYDPPLMVGGQLVLQVGRARLVAGRLAGVGSADEVMANEPFLVNRGARVGDTIKLGFYRADEFDRAGEGAVAPSRGFRDVRIVGVLRIPYDLQPGSPNGGIFTDTGHLVVGPGVLHAFDDDVATYGIALAILPKDESVDLATLLRERFPNQAVQIFSVGTDERDVLDAVGRSVHLQANSARAVALISALAALLFGGQSLTRQVRRELAMRGTLSALGLRAADVRRVTWLRVAPIVAIAVAVCPLAALLASPIGPIGIARQAELHLGIRADARTLGLGSVGVALAFAAMIAIAGRAPTPHEATPPRRTRRAASISVAACAGFASLRRAGGQRHAASIGCVAASAAAVAATILIGSLGALVEHPARYGFAWDAQVGNFGSRQQASDGIALLRRVPHITSAAAFVEQDGLVQGRFAPLFAFDQVDGYQPITPPVTAGRLPSTAREVALGRPLADALHKRIGDPVEVSVETANGVSRQRLTLVGHVVLTSLFPAVDPKNGVLVHPSLIGAHGTVAQNVAGSLYVRIDPAFRTETAAALKASFRNSYATAVPPPDVRNLQRVSGAPLLLALVIVLLAAASLAHALILMARASRHDLTVLRALGGSKRQARASLLWLATALVGPPLVLGAVVGMTGGRIGWQSIATGRALDQAPVLALPWIAAVMVGGLVVANAVAWLPARRSVKASPAAVLRAE